MAIIKKLYEHTYACTNRSVIDLTLSENPLGPSPKAIVAITKALSGINNYPSGEELIKALAAHHNISGTNIIVGAGANQLLEDILKIYALNQGIIVPSVTFPESVACITTLGGYAKTVPLKADFTLDLKALFTALEPDIALIHICNPNNPTGIWHNSRELISLADNLTVPLLISEVSADFIGDSILNHAIHENIIVVRSFSKAYGLAGLRVGYIVASEERINYMKRRLGSYRANSLGIAGAIAALRDSEHLNSSVNYLLQEKLYLMDSLKALGFEVITSQGQTFIAKVPKYFSNATTFCQTIAKHNMAVVNCSLYEGLEQYIRIAPQKHHINKQFILTLTKIIRDLYEN